MGSSHGTTAQLQLICRATPNAPLKAEARARQAAVAAAAAPFHTKRSKTQFSPLTYSKKEGLIPFLMQPATGRHPQEAHACFTSKWNIQVIPLQPKNQSNILFS